MIDIRQILAAFSAGLLSFFSPCVLPLIPAYICFITGLSAEELNASEVGNSKKVKTILPESLLFILGFSIIFIALGVLAAFLGSFLFAKQRIIKIIGGLIVIFFGFHVSGLFNIKFLQYEKKLHLKNKPVTRFGSFLVGMVFGFGWTPCVGPILGGILMLAADKGSMANGALLLSFYSLGLGLPFLLLSVAIEKALTLFSKVKKHFKLISRISGGLLAAIGIWIIIGAL